MTLRPYRTDDLAAIADLFYQSVHTLCRGDYTEEQLDAWATGHIDEEAWDASFRAVLPAQLLFCFFQDVSQFFLFHRLEQIIGGSQADRFLRVGEFRIAADQDHSGVKTVFSYFFKQFNAVKPGHTDIRQQKIRS